MKNGWAVLIFYILILSYGRAEDAKDVGSPPPVRLSMRYVPFQVIPRSSNTSSNDCIPVSTDDFPPDVFSDYQREHGALLFHVFFGVYCFALLALVCNDYFLPCVEAICEKMNLSQDVAAATVMAFATSAPELCVNLIGTFVTKSDIGIGTIVGSAMFNTLGVAALGGLATSKHMNIAWGPMTRDSIIYIITVALFIGMCWDGRIYWYETLILVTFYVCYLLAMWSNQRILRLCKKIVSKCRRRRKVHAPIPPTVVIINVDASSITEQSDVTSMNHLSVASGETHRVSIVKDPIDIANDKILWRLPPGSCSYRAWFLFSWPLRFLLYYTIPDHRRWPCGLPATFAMCVFWIGFNSYLVSWMITIIGDTLGIADFVMGLTFLAAGGCLPEATSIVILSRKGEGGMGVSNSLGANIQDILLALGLPWFIQSMIQLNSGVDHIEIGSRSLLYTITALILAVVALYATIAFNGYKLNRKVGVLLLGIYALFLAAAILLEVFLISSKHVDQCS